MARDMQREMQRAARIASLPGGLFDDFVWQHALTPEKRGIDLSDRIRACIEKKRVKATHISPALRTIMDRVAAMTAPNPAPTFNWATTVYVR